MTESSNWPKIDLVECRPGLGRAGPLSEYRKLPESKVILAVRLPVINHKRTQIDLRTVAGIEEGEPPFFHP